ncbi:MAG: hypothetical protein R3E44_07610 [Paracoccaceae bacterium]
MELDDKIALVTGSSRGVGAAALYLASSRSSWVTGIVLDVAGGAVMV